MGLKKKKQTVDSDSAPPVELVEEPWGQPLEVKSSHSFDTESSRRHDFDTPQASQDRDSQQRQNIPADDVSNALECEYSTPIIRVLVGPASTLFLVHLGILIKSSVLEKKCRHFGKCPSLELEEVQPKHFELMLRYLYTGQYQNFPKSGPEDGFSTEFMTHAEVYCLAIDYKLNDLASVTTAKMATMDKMKFQHLVEIAKTIYPKLHDHSNWFSENFKAEASRAIMENSKVAEEPWILDIYENGGGKLAVDLFKTFVGKLAEKRPVISEIPAEAKARSFPMDDIPASQTCLEESLAPNAPDTMASKSQRPSGKADDSLADDDALTEKVKATVTTDDEWDNWDARNKKKAKKGKKGNIEDVAALSEEPFDCLAIITQPDDKCLNVTQDIAMDPQSEQLNDGRSFSMLKKAKKGKKSKKAIQPVMDIPPSPKEVPCPSPDLEICTSRSTHLQDEALWMNCCFCRRELAKVALGLP